MEKPKEIVEAILAEGATIEEIESESRRRTEDGMMCIVFPTRDLMNHWLRRISAP